jgi:hypothetical protein
MLLDLNHSQFHARFVAVVVKPNLRRIKDHLSKTLTPDIGNNNEIQNASLVSLTKELKFRVVLGDKGLVIEQILEPPLERLERPKVDRPVAEIELRRFELEVDAEGVSMDEAAVRLCAPLPEGAAESEVVIVGLGRNELLVGHGTAPFRPPFRT